MKQQGFIVGTKQTKRTSRVRCKMSTHDRRRCRRVFVRYGATWPKVQLSAGRHTFNLSGHTDFRKQRETKMVQRIVRYGAIMTVVPTFLLSFVILISVVHHSNAQGKTRTAGGLACGQQLKQQCGGVPVQANNMLECLQKNQEKLHRRCVVLANSVVRRCDRDAAQHCQAVVAGQGNILGCLTTARRLVSRRCNASLDALFLRQ